MADGAVVPMREHLSPFIESPPPASLGVEQSVEIRGSEKRSRRQSSLPVARYGSFPAVAHCSPAGTFRVTPFQPLCGTAGRAQTIAAYGIVSILQRREDRDVEFIQQVGTVAARPMLARKRGHPRYNLSLGFVTGAGSRPVVENFE